MWRRFLPRAGAVLLAACAVVLPGCTPALTVVRVKVVSDGKPVAWKSDTSVLAVGLAGGQPAGNDKHPGFSFLSVSRDGDYYVIDGGEGNGVPPGRYAVTVWIEGEKPKDDPLVRQLAGLRDGKNSPLTCDIGGLRKQTVVADVAKKTVAPE